jgi:hypothetical protein
MKLKFVKSKESVRETGDKLNCKGKRQEEMIIFVTLKEQNLSSLAHKVWKPHEERSFFFFFTTA